MVAGTQWDLLPVDPWFQGWLLHQRNATADQYTLDFSIREDLDGDGWTNGSEDSFRLGLFFSSASLDGQQTLIGAPVSRFA